MKNTLILWMIAFVIMHFSAEYLKPDEPSTHKMICYSAAIMLFVGTCLSIKQMETEK